MGRSRSRSRSRERRSGRGRDHSPQPRRRREEDRPRSRERRRSRSRERARSPKRSDDRRGSPPCRRSPPPDSSRRPCSRSRSRERMPPPPRVVDRQPLPPQELSYRVRDGPGPAAAGARPPRACHTCGEEGHIARDCPKGGGRGARTCHKCGQPGHIARECPNAAGGEDESGMRWGKDGEQEEEKVPEKEPEPDFGLSGALAAETNKHESGVVLAHQEPAEARKPTQARPQLPRRWRLYVFKKGEQQDDPLFIHRQSRYLLGRERRVADIPTDHPSCSKQHAVIQFRLTEKEGPDGMMKAAVRPYVMDLGSTNGTFLNRDRLDPERYYELLEKDLLRFGNSTREYVLMLDRK